MTSAWRSSVSLVEETAALIRERVFAGRYRPGDRLTQTGLSAELGLSRTPLREALRLLEQDGIVVLDSAGSTSVATATPAQLQDAYAFREALETAACRLACPRLTPGTLAELDRLVDEQRRVGGPRFHQLVSRFHAVLLEASGNSYLQKHLSLVRMTEEVFRPRYGLTTEAALETVGAHAAVVNSLRQRAPDEAERHIRTYLAQQLDIMMQQERQPQ
ncbi:GntR family transcriptional regulator [Arthrobacter crystallopoietes]|uniref:GntR family transcriptional regulator n=1 Tax=Crystallibacter crystallopoietes TaxID=37928 RepID=UPI001ABEC3B0|nr:GntR family transcriptional regulator [Arthrobacter crystallopoietes]QTG82614.1 GntR family transcriptional regulator [Arthrobacter crystallopoietes]